MGCTSVPLRIETHDPPGTYRELGEGSGAAVGIMLFDVIPIGQNQRLVRAYEQAVASRGGTRLKDPTIEERWFWAYVLNGYITRVSGTVIADQ